ncbi:hypothetical protein tinsulaeT_38840 [Thalassotalea insulae]|uniref:PLAT domain-containing protein n=1 Tax=Thalassotalea insulae TaxID=2056778 RepID=A0ABQ6GZ64_9GAMM|nr:hypothetical protein [Thalassotalea insulae]GLX80544.1 hypothetical protein tinsulaeT_38840 [Thalassotalea insulae]
MRTLFFLTLFFTLSAHGGSAEGKVVSIIAHSDGGNGHGVFMFVLDGERSDVPTCSTDAGGKAWAQSLEKESGRAMYSLVLSAQAQNKTIKIIGYGNCDTWGDRE